MTRRRLDLVMAIAVFPAVLVVFVALALLLRLAQGSPVIFVDERIGQHGTKIRIHKFRTMRRQLGPGDGGPISLHRDPRVTRLGHVLRASRLDEVPQIWDVLAGRVTWVGPRPEAFEYIDVYRRIAPRLLDDPPGIVGIAAFANLGEGRLLVGPDAELLYRDVILPEKLAIELAYARRRTAWSDLGLFCRAPIVVLIHVIRDRRATSAETEAAAADRGLSSL